MPAILSAWQWLLALSSAMLGLYVAAVAALILAGRRSGARALAGFVPDCVVLFRRLLGDPRVVWWRKLLLAALVAYLALPIDLGPDIIPVAGQIDDLLLVAFVLRIVLRSSGETLLREHWPGPEPSLRLIRRLAYGAAA